MNDELVVRWSSNAVRDFDKISEYYRANASAVERQVMSAIYTAVVALEKHPLIGQVVRHNLRKLFVARTPYAVFYRITGNAIQILRIRHGARRPLASERP